jgi:hypothetical protein
MTPQTLDFDTWPELYDYIFESRLNGQKKQSKELYQSLQQERQVEFQDYLMDMYYHDWISAQMLAQSLKFYADKNN